jgi:tripartite-type tricarboxylate transporter receptor subunit TctC
MALPQVSEDFRTGGVEPKWAGPAEFAETIRESHAAWGRLLGSVGFKKQ